MVVNVKYLNLFKKGEKVDLESLVEKGIVAGDEVKKYGVKILGDGDLQVALTVDLPTSRGAAKKIVQAGGKVVAAEKKAISKKKQSSKPARKKTLKKK